MSDRLQNGFWFVLAWLIAAWFVGTAVPASLASLRTENADRAQAGLAKVDSLLAIDQADQAVQVARRLHDQLAADPLYGWQIEGRLGLALMRAGNPAEALPHLEAVMRRNPHDHVGHRNFAAALLATGKRGRALSEYRQAVELGPGDYDVRLEYGQVLAEFGDYREARSQLEVARSLCSDCLEANRALAGVLLEAGDFTAAIEPLKRIMEEEPSPWARLSLAQSLTGAGHDRDLLVFLDSRAESGLSAQEWNLVVEAEGRLQESHRSLACLGALTDSGSLPGGLPEDLRRAPGFWGRISLNLLQTGHYQEGLAAADQAVSLDRDNVVYRNNRVVLLLKLGREEEAAREWEEVLRLDPSLAEKENE